MAGVLGVSPSKYMCMTYFSRADWGAREARPGPGNLDPDMVVGIALHWPAMQRPLAGQEVVKAALRSWQAFHMDDKGWSDIAYQEAIDQQGNVYALRGLQRQSGANGDQTTNQRYGSLLLVLGPGEGPTAEMMAVVRGRIAEHRRLFPRSHLVVGHNQIRPEATACPGPAVLQLIAAGAFEPVPYATREQRAKARKKLHAALDFMEKHKIPGRQLVRRALKKTHQK